MNEINHSILSAGIKLVDGVNTIALESGFLARIMVKNGKANGEYKILFPCLTAFIDKGTFKDGKRIGDYVRMHHDKYTFNIKTTFDENEDYHGEYKEWYKNGYIRYHGMYVHGKKDGEYKEYDKNGVFSERRSYRNGTLHGEYMLRDNGVCKYGVYINGEEISFDPSKVSLGDRTIMADTYGYTILDRIKSR